MKGNLGVSVVKEVTVKGKSQVKSSSRYYPNEKSRFILHQLFYVVLTRCRMFYNSVDAMIIVPRGSC
jgi:hypothetical protein